MVAQDTTFLAGRSPEPVWDEQLSYWRAQLSGVAAPDLFVDRAADAPSGSTAIRRFDVPPEAATWLTELTDQFGVPLLALAAAAVQIVLGRYAGSEDVVVATVAGGDRPGQRGEGQDNVVVLRSRLTGSSSFMDFVRQVGGTVTTALAHSDVPFRHVAGELGLGWDLVHVAVVCGGTALPPVADLAVRLVRRDTDLGGSVEYREGRFDAAFIDRFVGNLHRVLEVVCADPGIRLHDIDILPADERSRWLVEGNDTARDVKPTTLTQLFETQAARAADLPALLFEGGRMTYAGAGRAREPAGRIC